MSFHVYKNLASINGLSKKKAVATFLDCCGSTQWALEMERARPFKTLEELFKKAEDIWFSLNIADHLEAFAAHPEIGGNNLTKTKGKRSTSWFANEEGCIKDVPSKVKKELAEINRLYKKKFGFIFIVCPRGQSAETMLAIARARIGNSVETELNIAAAEQSKITEVRLSKLLEK